MAIPHAEPATAIDVRPLGEAVATSTTRTLIKTGTLEVIRLVLPAGKQIAEHRAPGEITLQCLEGRVAFSARGGTVELRAGELLYLDAREPHALRAVEPSSLLLTLLLPANPTAAGAGPDPLSRGGSHP